MIAGLTLAYILISIGLVLLAGLMSGVDSLETSFLSALIPFHMLLSISDSFSYQSVSNASSKLASPGTEMACREIIAAGLTLGLLSLDSVDMEVISNFPS